MKFAPGKVSKFFRVLATSDSNLRIACEFPNFKRETLETLKTPNLDDQEGLGRKQSLLNFISDESLAMRFLIFNEIGSDRWFFRLSDSNHFERTVCHTQNLETSQSRFAIELRPEFA